MDTRGGDARNVGDATNGVDGGGIVVAGGGGNIDIEECARELNGLWGIAGDAAREELGRMMRQMIENGGSLPAGASTLTSISSTAASSPSLACTGAPGGLGVVDESAPASTSATSGSGRSDIDDCPMPDAWSNETAPLITEKSTFGAFSRLANAVILSMEQSGMQKSDISRRTGGTFSEEEGIEKFGYPTTVYMGESIGIPSKGYFKCSGKGPNGEKCPFNVGFSYCRRYKHCFVINSTEKYPLCLDHNHPATGTTTNGRFHVQKERDLEEDEIEKCNTLALCTMGIAGVKDVLTEKFPNRLYCSKLLHRVLDKIRDAHFGKERHQIGTLFELGNKAAAEGGVWVPEFCPDTQRIRATHYQTGTQRKYALQFGTYFATADGTHLTNRYKLTMCPFVTCDSLGLSHNCGTGLYPSESSPNITKTATLIGIAARRIDVNNIEQCLDAAAEEAQPPPPTVIDGIEVFNPVAKNSYRGSFFTDEASWEIRTKKALNKDDGCCTKHKSVAIFESKGGLDELASAFINDMYSMIYDIFSEEGLDQKFAAALDKYGHRPNAKKFIDGLRASKNKFCQTYMQYVFSFGHTTTQRGEGYNDRFKGHGELKQTLSKANLVKVHRHIDRVSDEVNIKAIKLLADLRKACKRWSDYYQSHLDVFKMKCATDVISCSQVEAAAGDGNLYQVTDKNGRVTNVNLATKIMHLGIVYTVPTCDCGDWCSFFIMCPCIIRSLTLAGRTIENVHNIHPIHLIQLHPMWSPACEQCHLADYDDFPQLAIAAPPSASGPGPVAGNAPANAAVALPVEFYDQFGRMPVTEADRIVKLDDLFRELKVAAVNKGTEQTFKMAHGRLLQAINEANGIIDQDTGRGLQARPPSGVVSGRTTAATFTNRSSLNRVGSSRPNKRTNTGNQKDWFSSGLKKGHLKVLCKGAKLKVTPDTVNALCDRLRSNAVVNEIGTTSHPRLHEQCKEKNLNHSGSKYELVVRLVANHFGTESIVREATVSYLANFAAASGATATATASQPMRSFECTPDEYEMMERVFRQARVAPKKEEGHSGEA